MRERSKLPVLLTELVIMILIFSLCAGVCLSIFASARRISRESGELSEAASLAQSAAEVYRASRGDLAAAAAILDMQSDGAGYVLHYDAAWNPSDDGEYALFIGATAEDGAHIDVTGGGETIFSLDVKAVRYG
ncbi:MAG: hypothetical protein RRY09_06650 [Oscillospiraceae bacterium]